MKKDSFDKKIKKALEQSLIQETESITEVPTSEEFDNRMYRVIDAYGKKEKHAPLIRLRKIAIAACLIFCFIGTSNYVVAATTGINLLAILAEWGKDVFHISIKDGDTDIDIDIKGLIAQRTYKSINKAVSSENLDIVYPKWLPFEKGLEKVMHYELEQGFEIQASYKNNGLFRASCFTSTPNDKDEYEFAVNDEAYENYVYSEITHYYICYKMADKDMAIILWRIGDTYYRISGEIQQSEVQRVINSMYE